MTLTVWIVIIIERWSISTSSMLLILMATVMVGEGTERISILSTLLMRKILLHVLKSGSLTFRIGFFRLYHRRVASLKTPTLKPSRLAHISGAVMPTDEC